MKIKKVDDKPMVIHTKQKAKIHTHEPKQASIKGCNIYTVDRDPTKKSKDNYQVNEFVLQELIPSIFKRFSLKNELLLYIAGISMGVWQFANRFCFSGEI